MDERPDTSLNPPNDPVVIGVVSAPHGVRGALKVKAVGGGEHLRVGVSPFVSGERREITVSRATPKGFLVQLEGVDSREEVDTLRGEELTLDRSELDEPEEGEVYVADLPGLEVFGGAGESLGTVVETFPTAAHEVLVVRDGEGERLVPFTLEHVPEVDLVARRLIANPPEE